MGYQYDSTVVTRILQGQCDGLGGRPLLVIAPL
jgi:hypothetical protein